jgi:hypothetical protein
VLWVWSEATGAYDLGLDMASGTSPSITVLPDGSYEVAYQANTGFLWTYSPATGATDTGLAMAPDTSPSIVAPPAGETIVAYQNSSGTFCWLNSAYGDTCSGAMAPGTSPVEVAGPGTSYLLAAGLDGGDGYQSSTGILEATGPSGDISTGLAMMAGTSPSGDA